MGKITGFMEFERLDEGYKPVPERLKNYKEFVIGLDDQQAKQQSARCMDCGTPFCNSGCPVNNIIPDFNDLVFQGDWQNAIEVLHSTNNFPEFTGRICPAPCEAACTLNVNDDAVGIKSIEHAIIDRAWSEGWVQPRPAAQASGKKVAVVGSGPAGMAAAQQLARAGHAVTLFEKNDRVGGLLRYGIPDFKMEKHLIDRRVTQMQGEGVIFRTGIEVGVDISVQRLLDDYDLLVLAGGAEWPRDLEVPGRELEGVHFAMDFLGQQNRRVAGDDETIAAPTGTLSAKGKHIVVIGGGDTGSDCIGTSNRQGAVAVTQLEVMPQPPARENKAMTWPDWPLKMRTSSSQEEGCERDFSVLTKRVIGANGKVEAIECVRAEWMAGANGQMSMQEVAGSTFQIKADMVLLAMGFLGPRTEGLLQQSGVEIGPRGAVKAEIKNHRTSQDRIFACGDMRRGQSLVVWAIREGRECAQAVDAYLSANAVIR